MNFSIKDFFSICDQIPEFVNFESWSLKFRSLSHLLKKSLMENFIFCAVLFLFNLSFLIHTEARTIFKYFYKFWTNSSNLSHYPYITPLLQLAQLTVILNWRNFSFAFHVNFDLLNDKKDSNNNNNLSVP